MKVSVLVAQYFYQHRELNLPGIGSFFLDDAVTIPDINDKNFRDFFQYIQFKQKNIARPDDTFIDYIRKVTGKIKPLAESDLESYVDDGKLLLNIGKPFIIDGIGTLSKNKEGRYEFIPGDVGGTQRIEVISPEKSASKEKEKAREKKADAEQTSKKKSVFDTDYYPHEANGNSSRKLLIIAGVLIGIAIIVWGGYSLYNKKVNPAAAASEIITQPVVDTLAQQQADSLARAKAIADSILAANSTPAGNYKFVLESTPNKKRAIRRHLQVNDLNHAIKMETLNDSTLFKIYVILPATPADTTRIKDSLNAWYYGSRPIKISIER